MSPLYKCNCIAYNLQNKELCIKQNLNPDLNKPFTIAEIKKAIKKLKKGKSSRN
jgi:hypothetical protein